MRFKDQYDKTVASVTMEQGSSDPTIDMSVQLNAAVAELLRQLEKKETVDIRLDGESPPEALLEVMGDKPILFFMYLDHSGIQITAKRATTENYPVFKFLRVGKTNRIYACNNEAQNILIAIMGTACRAIVKGMQDEQGQFYITPVCRPAGMTPEEQYTVEYTVGTGDMAYTDRQTCSRDELLDFFENPKYSDLKVMML